MITGAALELPEVPAYLIERGLLDRGSVTNRDLTLVDLSSRNRNYLVSSRRGRCFFIKQAVDPSASVTLSCEASLYRWISANRTLRTLRSRTPSLVHYDPTRGILVLTSEPRAVTAATHRAEGKRFPSALARDLGTSLAALHRETRGTHELGGSLPSGPAWVLSACLPDLQHLRGMSAATIELTRMAQREPDLVAHLSDLRAEWRNQCVIHGDLKSQNLLVTEHGAGHRPAVTIVDWELASFGDSCWDVGSILADVLSSWLSTAPISPTTPPDRIPSLTRYPLSRELPLIRTFWRAYARSSGWNPGETSVELLRSVRFAAARLIQTAIETCQTSVRLTGYSVCLLQLSRNLLVRPHEGTTLMLGLSLHPGTEERPTTRGHSRRQRS